MPKPSTTVERLSSVLHVERKWKAQARAICLSCQGAFATGLRERARDRGSAGASPSVLIPASELATDTHKEASASSHHSRRDGLCHKRCLPRSEGCRTPGCSYSRCAMPGSWSGMTTLPRRLRAWPLPVAMRCLLPTWRLHHALCRTMQLGSLLQALHPAFGPTAPLPFSVRRRLP